MLDGKLMLVDDDGKPLNKVDYSPVNSDSDSDVKVAYDETAQFMASGGANDASLYDDENYDIYGTYDIEGLTKQQLTFCDMMDIELRGRNEEEISFDDEEMIIVKVLVSLADDEKVAVRKEHAKTRLD
ncbi:hypothetical protein Tco_1025502 [Tanacetum coccineum]